MRLLRRSSRSGPLSPVALLIAALACPAALRAAEPSPTELAVARRLFDEAVRLEQDEHWQLAADKLRQAIQVKDTPGLRFHLAHCEEKLGLLVEALLDYRRARDLIDAGSRAPDVERLLGPAHAALEARVPVLVVALPADVRDVTVALDGKVLGAAAVGQPAPVNPGPHRVVVRAPEYQEFVRDITLAERERQSVEVRLLPVPKAPAAAPKVAPRAAPVAVGSPDSRASARNYVLVGESAVTLAALGVGIAYWMVRDTARERAAAAREAKNAESTDRTACVSSNRTPELRRACDALTDAVSDYHDARWLSAAGFVTAGAGAVATVLTFVLWPVRDEAPQIHAAATSTGMSLSVDMRF